MMGKEFVTVFRNNLWPEEANVINNSGCLEIICSRREDVISKRKRRNTLLY